MSIWWRGGSALWEKKKREKWRERKRQRTRSRRGKGFRTLPPRQQHRRLMLGRVSGAARKAFRTSREALAPARRRRKGRRQVRMLGSVSGAARKAFRTAHVDGDKRQRQKILQLLSPCRRFKSRRLRRAHPLEKTQRLRQKRHQLACVRTIRRKLRLPICGLC